MPRLRNKATGVVVSVGDDLAGRLGSEWEPVKKPMKAEASAPRRSKRTKSED